MKFNQLKSGTLFASLRTSEDEDYKLRNYQMVLKKDADLATMLEISEGDAVGDWFYKKRKIDSPTWEEYGWEDLDTVSRVGFFNTVFTGIDSLDSY